MPTTKPGIRPTGKQPAARTTGAQPAGDKVTAAYQDLLKEIVEKKQKAAEIRRRPPKKKKGPIFKAGLAVILPPIVAAVWIFQPFADREPVATRVPDDAAVWRTTLIDAANTIKDFRDSAGAFPADLESASLLLAGVTYSIEGPEQFTLQTFTTEGLVKVWMSGDTLGFGNRPAPPLPAEAVPIP